MMCCFGWLAFRGTRLILAVLLLGCVVPLANAQTRLRLAAANISSDNLQSYPNNGPGQRILAGTKPDVVMMQEFNIGVPIDNSATSTNNWVTTAFGSLFNWHREAGSKQIPNGIISRYPILASGNWVDS